MRCPKFSKNLETNADTAQHLKMEVGFHFLNYYKGAMVGARAPDIVSWRGAGLSVWRSLGAELVMNHIDGKAEPSMVSKQPCV